MKKNPSHQIEAVTIAPTIFKNIVFEGGGVLGAAYLGVIECLHERKQWLNIDNFAGASIGGVISILAACRPTIAKMSQIMQSLEISRIPDVPWWPMAIWNIFRKKGVCPGTYFYGWMQDQMTDLMGRADITLGEIAATHGSTITVALVNISKRKLVYISTASHPGLSAALLARAAMSISGLFIPVDLGDGDLYVDGGLLNNYPIQCFHQPGVDYDEILKHTIGAMLIADSEFQVDFPQINGVVDYVLAHLHVVWNWPQKMHISDKEWDRTIKIRTGQVSSVDFNITKETTSDLVTAGKNYAHMWFLGVPVEIPMPFPTENLI